MRQQHPHNQHHSPERYTVSEVAQYDYCPLVWWNEQYDPRVTAETEELFAQLVKMEHEYGQQATTLPDYQVIEQLLVRRGAFEAESHASPEYFEQEEYLAEIEAEHFQGPTVSRRMRWMRTLAFIALGAGIFMMLLSLLIGFLLH
jgi:hypothetical protein